MGRTRKIRRPSLFAFAFVFVLSLSSLVGVQALNSPAAEAKQNGCATVYSSGYVKSVLGFTLGRVRAHAYWCDQGNTITLWDAWGSQKSYQGWSFNKWNSYVDTASGSTSSYKRSFYDGQFKGFCIPTNCQYSSADRGLKAYASSGIVNGYG